MPKIITSLSIQSVLSGFSPEEKKHLNEKYVRKTNPQDRAEFKFRDFIGDLVSECAYRAEIGEPDGNWDEFAAQWDLSDKDYEITLALMKSNGYVPGASRW